MIKNLSLKKTLPYILILSSVIGLLASAVLIYDQVQVWRDPDFNAPCSLNPVLSCGTVINSQEGHVFGIPAPFLGLLMFPALATVGVILASGAKLKKWIWLSLQLAVTGGTIFGLWLLWISLYRINALCPYCLATDVAVITIAWYVTLFNIEQGYIFTSKRFKIFSSFIRKHHLYILIAIFLMFTALILNHFWYFYGQYF